VFSSLLLATVLPVELCWTACILLSIVNEGFLISGLEQWVFSPDLIDRANQVNFKYLNRVGKVANAVNLQMAELANGLA
jgi:hypothetical protein